MTSRPFKGLFPGSDPDGWGDFAKGLFGKQTPWKPREKPRCSGVWNYGPWKGQRCDETNPYQLVKCNQALDPGCEKYFCLTGHWHDHWNEHEAEVFDYKWTSNEPWLG